jgi:hypothetical protein
MVGSVHRRSAVETGPQRQTEGRAGRPDHPVKQRAQRFSCICLRRSGESTLSQRPQADAQIGAVLYVERLELYVKRGKENTLLK